MTELITYTTALHITCT